MQRVLRFCNIAEEGASTPCPLAPGVEAPAGDHGLGRVWQRLSPPGHSPFCRQRQQTIATEHSRRILDGLTAQNAATAPAQGAETAARDNTQPTAKTAHTAQEDGAGGGAAQG